MLGLLLASCAGDTTEAVGAEVAAGDSPAAPPTTGTLETTVDSVVEPRCLGPATAAATPDVPLVGDPETPRLPVTVTDLTGRDVTISDTSRILALDSYGTLASTVFALGLGDSLVGRDISTGIPELMDLPLVTQNGHQLNGEAILDLDPSVILTDYSIGPLEVQLQLMESGIPVVVFPDQRGRDVIGSQIEAVAATLGVPEAGATLAGQVESEIREVEARIDELAPVDSDERLRMIFLYMRGNAGVFYWFGEGSGADDLIESLHGVDVATESGLSGMRPLNAEGLVKSEPDMFLMMTLGLESVGGVEGLLEIPGIAETTAGATSCVVDMSDYQILSFGPQVPGTLDALGSAIYEVALG